MTELITPIELIQPVHQEQFWLVLELVEGRPHIHPHEPRVITVREAARLQSFPDWYVFHGTSTAQYRQVGNAVPPLLAYEVGKKIKEALQRFK